MAEDKESTSIDPGLSSPPGRRAGEYEKPERRQNMQ